MLTAAALSGLSHTPPSAATRTVRFQPAQGLSGGAATGASGTRLGTQPGIAPPGAGAAPGGPQLPGGGPPAADLPRGSLLNLAV
jgi:hypothetical protein